MSRKARRQSACGRWLSKGTVPILAVLLAGCGFHLQGRQPLPAQFSHTYVDTKDEQTDFVQDLRKALIASKVNVIPTKASAGATITVHEDELTERILSVSAVGSLKEKYAPLHEEARQHVAERQTRGWRRR